MKVKNPGHLVEAFHMDVVGLDPTWWQVHPPELNIYPGKEESAVVLLKPPANAQAPDEALPFGVRAVSALDAQRTVVEEGDLEVGRVLDLQASITPVTSKGRWSGRHQVSYANWGNSPVHLRLTVKDDEEALGFQMEPEQVSVPVGGSASARLRVRPRNPFLRGAAVRRPFQVIGESAGSVPDAGTPRSATARAGVPDPGRPVLDGAIQHAADPVQGRDRARRPAGGRDRRAGRRGVESRQRGGRTHPAGGARAADPTRRGSRLGQRTSSCGGHPATAPSSTGSRRSTTRTPCWVPTR